MGIECKTSVIGSVISRGKIKGIIAIIEKTEGGVDEVLCENKWMKILPCKSANCKGVLSGVIYFSR